MPASTSLFRSKIAGGSAPPPDPVDGAYVPPGAVLFLYGTWNSFISVAENSEWYDDYTKLVPPNIKWYETINNTTNEPANGYGGTFLDGGPHAIVSCVPNTSRWNKTTGIALAPNSAFFSAFSTPTTKYGNLLDLGPTLASDADNSYSGRHGYNNQNDNLSPGRPSDDKPKSFGLFAGETASTVRVPVHNVPHEGHFHFVAGDNIGFDIFNLRVGHDLNLDSAGKPIETLDGVVVNNYYDFETLNKRMVGVRPIQRKKNGSSAGPSWFPKDVMVFGLGEYDPGDPLEPADEWTYYTQSDDKHSGSYSKGIRLSTVTTPSFLYFSNKNWGGINAGSIPPTIYIDSSTNGEHSHQNLTLTTPVSTTTGQFGQVFVRGGGHNHTVSYTIGDGGDYDSGINIKSKVLNAWITTEDQTPIANGVIIAASYSQGGYGEIIDPKKDILPPNWHFCDGTNGTPDLRDYAPVALMISKRRGNASSINSGFELHNTVYQSTNRLRFTLIEVDENTQTHTHIAMAGNVPLTVAGTGTIIDITGSHTNLNDSVNEARAHTHDISTATTFLDTTSSPSVTRTKINENQNYAYNPPKAQLAFIMYNKNIS